MNHPHITCAVCLKRVERVVVERMDFSDSVRLRVWCHGDTDGTEFASGDFARMGSKAIDDMVAAGGTAFNRITTKELA